MVPFPRSKAPGCMLNVTVRFNGTVGVFFKPFEELIMVNIQGGDFSIGMTLICCTVWVGGLDQ